MRGQITPGPWLHSTFHSNYLGEGVGQWGVTLLRILVAKEAFRSRSYESSQALYSFHLTAFGLVTSIHE